MACSFASVVTLLFLSWFHATSAQVCSVGPSVFESSSFHIPDNTLYVIPHHPFDCRGVISRWEYYAGSTGSFRAMVLRADEEKPNRWQIVGINEITVSAADAGQKSVYFVPSEKYIIAERGDVIGLIMASFSPQIKTWESESLQSRTLPVSDPTELTKGDFVNTPDSAFGEISFSAISDASFLDADECTSNPCANGQCIDMELGYTCECDDGWSGTYCETDIDECASNTANCHTYAKCTNNEGSFTCTCNDGYEGNGVTCSSIATCAIELYEFHCPPNVRNDSYGTQCCRKFENDKYEAILESSKDAERISASVCVEAGQSGVVSVSGCVGREDETVRMSENQLTIGVGQYEIQCILPGKLLCQYRDAVIGNGESYCFATTFKSLDITDNSEHRCFSIPQCKQDETAICSTIRTPSRAPCLSFNPVLLIMMVVMFMCMHVHGHK